MRLLPRQMISSLTAAFVLLCNIYCACGGSVASSCHSPAESKTVAGQARDAAQGPRSQCHHRDHADAGSQSQREEHTPPQSHPPQRDGKHHQGDHTCPHCTPAMMAQAADSKRTAELTQVSSLIAISPAWACWFCDRVPAWKPAIAGDLPPPAGSPTLLSLHCALTL
jgi:hypothetical protein